VLVLQNSARDKFKSSIYIFSISIKKNRQATPQHYDINKRSQHAANAACSASGDAEALSPASNEH
jgi:hypothetical protein